MAEEPKGRVEIIMPGEEQSAMRVWVATSSSGVKIVKLGPLQSLAVAIGLLLILWLGFLFLSGVFLIIAPFAIVIAAGAYIAGLLGFRRPS